MAETVPSIRIRSLNSEPINSSGQYVLCWLTAARRLTWNFTIDRAVELAEKLKKPVLLFEAIRLDYPWASRRLHAFVIQGMRSNQEHAAKSGHLYVPYIERSHGDGAGLIEALAKDASVVVTDDFPCFFLPRMINSVARRVPVAMECVDGNGLLPMRAAESVYPTAYAFRRFLQKTLANHLGHSPAPDRLASARIPAGLSCPSVLQGKWAIADRELLSASNAVLSQLPIDQEVREGVPAGGVVAASVCLQRFLKQNLSRYGEERNDPDADVASGLSPYLHFGHISVHEILQEVAKREDWTLESLGDVRKTKGSREGWWGMSPSAESFMDELVTWRELGYNMCWQRANYDRYESLPGWAQETLEEHSRDHRPWLYNLDQLAKSETHDEIWNAAQRQLVQEGRMHNYLRMLWGKKILEWSPSPRVALDVMIELNNRYALDGRNPNSYSGIFWVLGRYDRPWGPERPIFGKIRYMTSDSTARKLNLTNYLRKYGPEDGSGSFRLTSRKTSAARRK